MTGSQQSQQSINGTAPALVLPPIPGSAAQPGAVCWQPVDKLFPGSAAQPADVFDPSGKYKIKSPKGGFTAVEVAITPNDGVKSEAGAMITLSQNCELVTSLEGGLGTALTRCCCAGESLFFSYYRIKEGGGDRGDVLLAPAVPGEIILLHLTGVEEWAIKKGSFLGADASVELGTLVQSFSKGCCSGEGFFILKAGGVGRLLINSYGTIMRYDLQPGEERLIENGFLVAWNAQMNYDIVFAGASLGHSIFSGQGLATRFVGPGTVYVQTRSIEAFAHVLAPHLPRQGGSGGGANSGV